MDSHTLIQLNEAYRNEVYPQEEILSEEEYLDIQEWVEALIDEGYDLDEYSDEELYEAYLADLEEGYKKLPVDRMIAKSKQLSKLPKAPGEPRWGKNDERASRIKKTAGTHNASKVKKVEQQNRKRGENKDIQQENLDLYDLVSEYLVSEGFCDSYEDADVIMANMSEEWRESILDEAGRMHSAGDQQSSWYAQKYGNNSKPRSDSEIAKEPGGKEFLARLKKAKEKSKK